MRVNCRLSKHINEAHRAHLAELKKHISRQDSVRAQMGLGPDDKVQVVVTRNVAPSGAENIRTIFGYGYMLNTKRTPDGEWKTVALVKRKNVDKVFKELGI